MLILSGCNEEEEPVKQAIVYEQIKETVAELNENSNLYIELLTHISETKYASLFNIDQIRQGFHNPPIPNEFIIIDENENIQGEGGVLPFPWATEDLRIIYTLWDIRGKFHVFGINVGDNLEEAKEVLHGRGFVIDFSIPQSDWNIERYGRRTSYMKDYVRVSLFVGEDEQEITGISITVHDPFIQWQTEDGEEGVDWVS
jgi:hypothetical protein